MIRIRQFALAVLAFFGWLFPTDAAEQVFRAGAFAIDVTPLEFPVLVNGGMTERTVDKVHGIIRKLVESGQIRQERIVESYRRIMRLKQMIGLPAEEYLRKELDAVKDELVKANKQVKEAGSEPEQLSKKEKRKNKKNKKS